MFSSPSESTVQCEANLSQSHFMFDGEMRDKLLFEDDTFTYSRRYFWAFQTLGLVSNGIKAIINEYKHNFTDDVWQGKHKSLWPLVEDGSHRNEYWRHRLVHLRKEFEVEIQNLYNLLDENEARRDEIKALETQLFQGTSVLESRRSVELAAVTILQGHNIRLLTLVSCLGILNGSRFSMLKISRLRSVSCLSLSSHPSSA